MLVFGVPIFGELEKGERSNKEPIGRNWHLAALANAMAQEAEEYIPPLHVRHHDLFADVERVGFFRPRRVGLIRYQGKMRSCLFANMYCSRAAAQRIKDGDLPYCSVEIGPDWNRPEILSCALLDHEPPHFKFPLITLADDAKFKRVGTGLRICFHAQTEAAMAKSKTEESQKPEADPKGDEQIEAKADDVENKDGENLENDPATEKLDDGGAETPPAWAVPLLALPAMLQKMTELLTGAGKGEPAAAAGTPPLAEPSYKQSTGEHSNETIQLRAKVAALEAKQEQSEKDAKLTAALNDARKNLSDKGWTITPKIEKTLLDAAKIGPSALKLTVETFTAHVVKDPPTDVESGLAAAAAGNAQSVEELPPELEPFSEKGPNRLALGRRAFAAWQQTRSKGSQLTFEAYCKTQGLTP